MDQGACGRAVSALGVRSRKLSNVYYLALLRALEGTFSHWSRLHLQSLAPTNPHWARVVVYDPFSLCVIYKEGLCSSSGDINGLMMMMMIRMTLTREIGHISTSARKNIISHF
jgi:hypothetical protein